jgi:hypothetical protein
MDLSNGRKDKVRLVLKMMLSGSISADESTWSLEGTGKGKVKL